MKADQDGNHLEELDLSIPNMDNEAEEIRAGEVLKRVPGVHAVSFVERGALVSYRAQGVTKDEIVQALRQSGFRADVFQDSATGEVGSSKV